MYSSNSKGDNLLLKFVNAEIQLQWGYAKVEPSYFCTPVLFVWLFNAGFGLEKFCKRQYFFNHGNCRLAYPLNLSDWWSILTCALSVTTTNIASLSFGRTSPGIRWIFFEDCAALYGGPFFVWINKNICTVPDEQVNLIVFDSRSNV